MIFKSFLGKLILILAFATVISQVAFGNNNSEINLVIDGTQIENMDSPPVIINGHTMVPARDVFEPLGAVVSWNPTTQYVYIGYNQNLIILEVNNRVANFNGTAIEMDMEARIINGRVMIPVRFVAETLGFNVNWNESTRSVYINTSATTQNNTNTVGNTSSQIPSMSFPTTRVTSISKPQPNQSHVFVIETSSQISGVNSFIVENDRLVIDIHNAHMNVPATDYTVTNSPNVSRIRVAQNELHPTPITRIVMELKALSDYNIYISEDRHRLYVSFEQNVITNINVNSTQSGDYISITGNKAPVVNVNNVANSLHIDIPNATFENIGTPTINSDFITNMQVVQINENTVRINLTLKQNVTYSVSYDNNTTTVRVGESSLNNIAFNSSNNTIIITKNPSVPINIQNIVHTNNYHNDIYILTLPGNHGSFFGYGEVPVNNERISSIEVLNQNSSTNIVINQNKINAVRITESAENIYIQVVSPREVYPKIVMLDPGHGGHDPGAVHFGVSEKDVVLDISNMVYKKLTKNPYIKVYATRTTDVFIPLNERAEMANGVADLFVSIHLNAVSNNNIVSGTETYYLAHDTDNTFDITRREAAEIFQRNLVNGLNTVDRGVRTANFAVLRNTNMPSVLLELGFLTNPNEAAMFATPEIQQKTAQIIYDSIIEIFEIYTPPR